MRASASTGRGSCSASLALLLAACSTPHASGPLAAPALMQHVAFLADPRLDGREAGTDGERAAARYVAEQLQRVGLDPIEQTVPYPGQSRNIHALLTGQNPAEIIVVGAHLDHLGRRGDKLYPGADDNASGVALVLGIAAELAARRGELGRSVLFVFFGAEERGMVGSRHFVAEPPVPLSSVRAMVNVDMIGRPLLDQPALRPLLHLFRIDRERAVGLVGTRRYPGLRALADAEFAVDGGELVAAEDLPEPIAGEVERQTRGRGDSVSFEQHGIPALFFGDGESADYHQPTDTIDRLQPELLERRARSLVRVIRALSRAPAAVFAASDAAPVERKPPSGLYMPLGFTNGLSARSGAGYFLGGELGLAYFQAGSHRFGGLYADALRDTGRGVTRLSAGPQLGQQFFGIDAGYVVELEAGSRARHGVVVRPFVTVSVLSLAARLGNLDGSWFGELGVALKLPLALHTWLQPSACNGL